MTALDDLFERQLPALLQRAPERPDVVVGFVATGEPEVGAWVVRVREARGRRTSESDRPDVVVEGSAAVLALLFSGALDVDAAIAQQVLLVRGDRAALTRLRDAVKRSAS